MSEATIKKRIYSGTGLLTLLLILCGGGLVVGSGLYAREGKPFLSRFDHSVGEMLMERGQHAENAGDIAKAMDYYTKALDTRFEGAQNRAFVQLRLGMIQLEAGNTKQAIEWFSRESTALYHTEETYSGYLHALLILKDELALAEALTANSARELSEQEFCWFYGKLALLQGDTEKARKHFQDGIDFDSASPCAVELAKLGAQNHTQLLEKYLLNGGTGEAAQEAREILSNLHE